MIKTSITIAVLIMVIRTIAFFSSSETAYLSLSKIKVRQLQKSKKKKARVAAELRNNIGALLTVVLIGTNFMNTFASALATSLAIAISGNSGIGIAVAVITFCATTFGQIIPKTAATVDPEKTAVKNSFILYALEKIFFPIVWIFTRISNFASFIAMKLWKSEDVLITEEELKTLFDVGMHEGTIEKDESRMLYKIFQFSDLSVHDIMKHRSLIKAIPLDADRNTVIELFSSSGLSQMPVYKSEKEEIVGVIHFKSILFNAEEKKNTTYAASIMKDVLFVPETFTALEMLIKFKKENAEFAIALNEQGETAGVITLNDIMRVVFDRMTIDENHEIPPEERIKLISANEFLVPGDIKLEEVNEILRLNLESEEFMTLGGWLLEKIGSLPSNGDVFIWKNLLFIIEDQAHRRIVDVRIRLNLPEKS